MLISARTKGALVAAAASLTTLLAMALAPAANAGHAYGSWVHWSDGAGGGPGYVTLVDYTGDQWPVYSAAIEWDRPDPLNVIYRNGSCGGFGHCVAVRAEQFALACGERAGQTILIRDGNHLSADTHVRLNTRCNDRADREQRVITCHEEGHVMGLGEQPESLEGDTCMGAQAGELGQATDKPGPHDFGAIRNIYGHQD